jgi:GAF domain-containing protein
MTARQPSERPGIHDVALALRQMFAAESGRHKARVDETVPREVVRGHELLGSPSDDAFDRISAVAARVVGAAAAIVSLVNPDRLWFTATVGLDLAEVTGEPGFASAILNDEPWIIEDARSDPRAPDNPLVAAGLGLQFYAGVPLTMPDGTTLGTLGVIDFSPRTLSEDELATLGDLSAIIVRELELRQELSSFVRETESAWLDSPDADENGSLITNRGSHGTAEVAATLP